MNSISLILNSIRHFTPEGRQLVIDSLRMLRNSKGKLCELDTYIALDGKTKTLESKLTDKSKSLKSIIKNAIQRIKQIGYTNSKDTVLNIKTGVKEPISIITDKIKDGATEICAIDASGKLQGKARILIGERHSSAGYNSNVFLDTVSCDSEKFLYIDCFATSSDYKGIGTKMLKKIVSLSQKSGFAGRVRLKASTGDIPPEFYKICGAEKCAKKSAAVIYHNMGFVCINPAKEQQLCAEIARGGDGFVTVYSYGKVPYKKDLIPRCDMELSPESIRKYLGIKPKPETPAIKNPPETDIPQNDIWL